MPKQLKYDKILDALQKLLETKELSNISVSEIAQTAEIGKGSILFGAGIYFSSKDAILEALVERNYEVPITTARHLAEQREISPFTRMALIFQACRNSSAAFLKTQPSTTKAAPERAFLHQKYMNHLIVSLKPVLASIIEQGIAQDLILCADPVSLAEIVLIVLTVKMDNTLVPSTADEIEQTISALVSLLEKGTENPAGSLNFLMAQL